MTLKISEKKDLAKLLWTRGVVDSQKELAERVKVSEQTISKWINAGKWQLQRRSLLTVREEQLAELYQALEAHTQYMRDVREAGGKPTTKDTDILIKLTGAIKNLEVELSVAEIVDVQIKFNDWARSNGVNLDLLKKLAELQDAFIKSKL